jgi:YYY domain-containing protein
MSWLTIFGLISIWYVVVQLVSVAVLPLTLRTLRALPDRGYSLAKILGILLTGVVYWLGYSYGLLRNERGGVWLALIFVAMVSWLVGRSHFVEWWRMLRQGGRMRAVVAAEVIFLLAFVGWALVRAYDPNVDHTEEPMDLMFMSSIWASATYPPQDAWLAGFPISYYYLGYWLLNTLGRLANTPPSITYNVGQAVWYGLLWSGCYAIVMNLLAWHFGRAVSEDTGEASPVRIPSISVLGGALAGVTVAFVGNLLVILEWLYAQGLNIGAIARWIDVHNFPENATQTGKWFIDYGWWWWRSSRVIEDVDLLGNRIEISPIDEFPMFSYLLGDNHPHVMAMPFVLLTIGLALNLMFMVGSGAEQGEETNTRWWQLLPLRWDESILYVVALGSLIFLNTWDFPPYWLLLVAVALMGGNGSWRQAGLLGALLFMGAIVVYLPYLLTAQSQAAGIVPNVFNPTRLPQFLVMFGAAMPATIGLIALGWRLFVPKWPSVGWIALLVLGAPALLLALVVALSSTAWAGRQLARMELPPDATSYGAVIVQRWLSEPWTLLFVGVLLSLTLAVLLAAFLAKRVRWWASADVVFVLMLAAIGLALVYAPEFVFLRDHFGSRMNTVFKFYYQGWLLLGLANAYLIAVGMKELRLGFGGTQVAALVSLALVAGSAIFPVAGAYAKTNGFARSEPTLDATAYVALNSPDVMAAVEWVRQNTLPSDRVLEAKGNSYSAHHNRISTMTGRATLLGWDGHESQWRGEAYGTMARGRPAAIEQVYRSASPEEIGPLLGEWGIDYVFVGPVEIELYGITDFRLEELGAGMDTVFERGQVKIFRRRASP